MILAVIIFEIIGIACIAVCIGLVIKEYIILKRGGL